VEVDEDALDVGVSAGTVLDVGGGARRASTSWRRLFT
jgi:hypothetical protein